MPARHRTDALAARIALRDNRGLHLGRPLPPLARADEHLKAARQAGRRTPTQRQPKVMYDRIQAGRTPGKCCSHIWRKAFNEDPRGAAGCGAAKTPGDKSNPNRSAMRE
jgi:hypothetical protein